MGSPGGYTYHRYTSHRYTSQSENCPDNPKTVQTLTISLTLKYAFFVTLSLSFIEQNDDRSRACSFMFVCKSDKQKIVGAADAERNTIQIL